jgi:hypothetical protein
MSLIGSLLSVLVVRPFSLSNWPYCGSNQVSFTVSFETAQRQNSLNEDCSVGMMNLNLHLVLRF